MAVPQRVRLLSPELGLARGFGLASIAVEFKEEAAGNECHFEKEHLNEPARHRLRQILNGQPRDDKHEGVQPLARWSPKPRRTGYPSSPTVVVT